MKMFKCDPTMTLYSVLIVICIFVMDTLALSGPNVCMVQQKYNITKRVKYRAPMTVRTYEWCFSMPPRCSRWNTEMRDLTRLETEERTAEVAVCCPGYKMKDVSCIPICPAGKTGSKCSEDCPPNKWGPNCVYECKVCSQGSCAPTTGACVCAPGWRGERCQHSMSSTVSSLDILKDILTTTEITILPSSSPSTVSTKPVNIYTIAKTTSNIPKITVNNTTSTSISVKATTGIRKEEKFDTEVKSGIDVKHPLNNVRNTENAKSIQLNQSIDVTIGTTHENIYSTTTLKSIFTNTIIPVFYQTTENISSSPSTLKGQEYKDDTQVSPPVSTTYTTEQNRSKSTVSLRKKEDTTITEDNSNYNTKEMTHTYVPKTSIYIKNITATTGTIRTTMPNKTEYTTKAATTAKTYSTTNKLEPKEIWIKPSQKGEIFLPDSKTKLNRDLSTKHRNTTKKEPAITTPRTIVVSIIPTSLSYSFYRKKLSTASYWTLQSYGIHKKYVRPLETVTKAILSSPSKFMYTTTPLPLTIATVSHVPITLTSQSTLNSAVSSTNIQGPKTTSFPITSKSTNSMTSTSTANTTVKTSSNPLTISSTNATTSSPENSKKKYFANSTSTTMPTLLREIKNKLKYNIGISQKNPETSVSHKSYTTEGDKNITTARINIMQVQDTKTTKIDITTKHMITITEDPTEDEETFHILTEPEHITAVMSDKGKDRTSVDLISVIIIAGGVMMAIITVAVIIVMVERCKRPRYEDIRKMNDIRMQVMLDQNDVPPPPYVRSIFHTPLPDPPTEKCHYQPISTLDRNLKQFMRPVVVQTISPLMLENFRGILECHYDHLPIRTHETRCSVAPSDTSCDELRYKDAISTEIDAMKCEANFNVIDSTTSEPLYAEIPCWRPPSEHAIEVDNNGEAVTEL